MSDEVEGTVKWFNDEKDSDSLSVKAVKMFLFTIALSMAAVARPCMRAKR
jgi:hypothetical protein